MTDTPKPTNLADAVRTIQELADAYRNAMVALTTAKVYDNAMLHWKDAHRYVLLLKAATNDAYKFLPELKPKTPKADKLKPGGAIDNPPAKKGKARRAAETDEVTDANSDEP